MQNFIVFFLNYRTRRLKETKAVGKTTGIQTTGQLQQRILVRHCVDFSTFSFKINIVFFLEKDEARKKREEKRVMRQKEIEAKRSARQGGVGSGGSMKLGGKKLGSD